MRGTLLVGLAALLLVGEARADTAHFTTWSGYLARGSTFTRVSAKWVQPTVTCKDANDRVSIWVGLDGDGTDDLEQDGTIAVCTGTGPATSYRGWWERIDAGAPSGSQQMAVSPGDKMDASVEFVAGQVTMTLKDETSGQSLTKILPCAANCPRATAEWIVERPGSGTYPLADFARVKFTDARFRDGESPGPGERPNTRLERLDMVSKGVLLAQPGSLDQHGGAGVFEVVWKASH